MSTQEFESTKAFLKQADGDGVSLYDHLTAVLLKIAKEKPDNALEVFETLSQSVKNGSLKPAQHKELPTEEQEGAVRSALLASIARISALSKIKNNSEEDEEEGPSVPDLLANADLFEWAGVNVGKEETYKILLAITELVNQQNNQETPIKSVRFWGKIFGLQSDYIVVEAQYLDWPAEEDVVPEGSDMEAPGEGANEYVYFVTNSVEGKWTQLPYVTPTQIQTAKKMRRFFTGNLKAPVLGFPRFPWGEAAYLRAQIARITAATVVSPVGFYIPDEEAEDESIITEDMEFVGLTPAELKAYGSWSHHRSYLLNKQGRVTAYIKPEEDDEEEEIKEDEEEEEEEVPARLTTVDEDVDDAGFGAKKLWSLRISPSKSNPHAVVSIHSLNWPGAVAVGKKKNWANIYIGYGHKYLSTLFTPPPPPTVQLEFASEYDPEEGPDPMEEQVDPLPKPVKAGKENGEEDDEEEDDEEY